MGVKYKYPEETEARWDDADNYEIKLSVDLSTVTKWQAQGLMKVGATEKTSVFTSYGTNRDQSLTVIDGYWALDPSNIYLVSSSYSDEQIANLREGKSMYPGALGREVLRGSNIFLPTSWAKDLEILFWHPADGTILYELILYQEDSVLFRRIEPVRPEYVELFNAGECPEGTCPVICGAYTCCYDIRGIAVESFLNP